MSNNQVKFEPIKTDFNNIGTVSISDAYKKMMERLFKSIEETEEKIINEFAEEHEISLKCAKAIIYSRFKFKIETISPDSMIGTPAFNLVLEPKSPEEILDDIDTWHTYSLKDCDKELLKKELQE